MPVLSQPGTHTRLTMNALGHATGAGLGGATFNHPFRPALSSGRVSFQLGTVTSLAGDGPLEPKIKAGGQGAPMSGLDGITPTPLALRADVANSEGISWAVLEVYPDDTGELTKDSKVEIVHSAETVSHTPDLGRCAIAMILWSGKSPLRVLPIVHFNLRYVRLLPPPGGGAPRHLFL